MTDFELFESERPDQASPDAYWSLPDSLVELASDDSELITDLISAFQADTETRMLKIDKALRAGEFSVIGAQAHTIKGASRQLGAHTLAEACQKLEGIARTQDRELAAGHMVHIRQVLASTLMRMASSFEGRSGSRAVPQ